MKTQITKPQTKLYKKQKKTNPQANHPIPNDLYLISNKSRLDTPITLWLDL